MWLLKDSNGKITYLKPGIKLKIGRKQADLVLENDTSISRTHSSIEVLLKEELTTAERTSTCIVRDENSKYGTHITREGVKTKASNEGFELQPSDTLQFGLQQHVFKVEYISLVSVVSRLTNAHRKQLEDIMKTIGGLITDTFDNNCTHLTATTATSTTKIVSAIIAGLPVIDINFWLAVLKAVEKNEKLPDPSNFTLPLQDKGIYSQRVSLKPNPSRKTLFQGKTFVFFSENVCREYSKMIKSAGGKTELYRGDFESIPDNFFSNNTLIMQVTVETLTNDLAAFNTLLYDKMQEKKIRMISETEIPLAILYASLDQYCNPKYHFKELIKRKSLKKDESKILALDTQDIEMPLSDKPDNKTKLVCLPETNDFIEENITKDEVRGINTITSQIDSEMDLITEDSVQEKNTGDNDNMLISKVMNPKKKIEALERIQTVESSDVDNSANSRSNSRSNSNFRLKRPSATALEFRESKKQLKEKISDDDMTNNVQSGWKTKKRSSALEIIQQCGTLIKSKNDFDELEERRNDVKEKKIDKLSKLGFKKITKKSIDFDLDDFEEDEPKVEVSQKTNKSSRNLNRERENSVEQEIESFKPSNTLQSYQDSKNLQTKSLSDNITLKENMEKKWTAFKAKSANQSNLSTDNENRGSTFVKPSIKMEEVIDGDVRKGSKTFKKVHNIIPIKRIALADMTVWRPNS